jgi:hypothetical protein
MKYPPLFKRVPMDDKDNHIAWIQHEFEMLWKKLSPKIDKSPEKTQAMRKLQEACFYLTRGEALAHFVSTDEVKPVTPDKPKSPYGAKPKGPAFANTPTIKYKRKKA